MDSRPPDSRISRYFVARLLFFFGGGADDFNFNPFKPWKYRWLVLPSEVVLNRTKLYPSQIRLQYGSCCSGRVVCYRSERKCMDRFHPTVIYCISVPQRSLRFRRQGYLIPVIVRRCNLFTHRAQFSRDHLDLSGQIDS